MSLRLGGNVSNVVVTELARAVGLGTCFTSDFFGKSREEAFSHYTASGFRDAWLRTELFSKWSQESDTSDLDVPAWTAFFDTESVCESFNSKLVDMPSRAGLDHQRWMTARKICKTILGPLDLDVIVRKSAFSGGASTEFARRISQQQQKWGHASHVTERAIPYALAFFKWAGVDLSRKLEVVQGNRVTTVPKNWKTNRMIAVEPTWNLFFQKGVGNHIRDRLQRFGLLGRQAQDNARKLALYGSLTGKVATLDLKAASDSVSLGLIDALLPEDWRRLLFDLRSPEGDIGGGTFIRYAKVSSMGNGFTFELETLLFYALTCAIGGLGNPSIHVYGDDIICPAELAGEVAFLLFEAGFELNADKSFAEGPFRESCGGHYWKGVDVTPFYVKRPLVDLHDAIDLHNRMVRWCEVGGYSSYEDFTTVFQLLRRSVPRKFFGPCGEDGVLWSSWDEAVPAYNKDFQAWRLYRITKGCKYDSWYDFSEEWGAALHSMWNASLCQQYVTVKSMSHAQFANISDVSVEHSTGVIPAPVCRQRPFYVDRHGWIAPTVRMLCR